MKVVELLKISTHVLSLMNQNGLFLDDYKYVKAYEEYLCMRGYHVKHIAAITELAEELGVSTRTLERAFKRLRGECKV